MTQTFCDHMTGLYSMSEHPQSLSSFSATRPVSPASPGSRGPLRSTPTHMQPVASWARGGKGSSGLSRVDYVQPGTLGVWSWLPEAGRATHGPRLRATGQQGPRLSPPVSTPRRCPQPGCRGLPSTCPCGPLHYDSLGSRSPVPGGSMSDVCATWALSPAFLGRAARGGRVHCPKPRGLGLGPTWSGWTAVPRRPSYRPQFCPRAWGSDGGPAHPWHRSCVHTWCAVCVPVRWSLCDGCRLRWPAGLRG